MDVKEIVSKLCDEEKIKIVNGKDKWNTYGFERLDIEPVAMSDGPHGLRIESSSDKIELGIGKKSVCYPTASALSTTWNRDLIREVGEAIGEEAAYNKVDVVLGPGVNVKRNPLCGRNFEYYSEDPYLAGMVGAEMIKGIQKNGTGACVKHFTANNQEYRRMSVNAVVDQRALREIYLTPFEIAVKESRPKMLMTSYNRVNGEYANENKTVLHDVLREDWGYEGVVVSDWGGTNDITKSINAGADLSMPHSEYFEEKLRYDYSKGLLDEQALDKAVERIVNLKKELSSSYKAGESGIEYEYNLQIAKKASEESIVLLKNDGVLPLNHFDPVSFIGDTVFDTVIQGGGSSRVNPYKKENLSDKIYDYDLNVKNAFRTDFLKKKKRDKSKPYTPDEDETAVFLAGYDDYYETEGTDRASLSLPERQISAYRSVRDRFKKVVTVIISGSVVDLSPFSDSNAIVFCPYSGEKEPTAVMEVLTGAVNPSGKLSETVPLSYDDVPCKDRFHDKFTSEYRESIFVGYRYYEKTKTPVSYPFGFGLSYTSFGYYEAEADKTGVKFTVKNTGDTDGAEICQIYVSKPESKVFRPLKELKGFTKVFLKAGEQKTVYIPFDEYTFRYYNTDTGKFEQEAGNYKIYVASSSEDVRLAVSVLISGTAKQSRRDDLPSYYSGFVKDVSPDEFQRLYGDTIPREDYAFYKKNRIVVGMNTTLSDMIYAKGFLPRLLGKYLNSKLKRIDKLPYNKAMNVYFVADAPVRTVISYLNYNMRQVEGFLEICNGNFFKGLYKIIKKQG